MSKPDKHSSTEPSTTARERTRREMIAGSAVAAGAAAIGAALARPRAADLDQVLVAAERELVGLCRAAAAPRAPDSVFDRINDLETLIATETAHSLAGAAVKLRLMLDPVTGIAGGTTGLELPAITTALAAIDRAVGAAGRVGV